MANSQTQQFFLNLSDLALNTDMISLLNKGLSFCPTPTDPNFSQIMSGVNNLHKQMRRTAFFQSLDDSDSDSDPEPDSNESGDNSSESNLLLIPRDSERKPFDHHKFKNPSKFDPPAENFPVLDTFCKTTRLVVYKHTTKPPKFCNLSKGERQAIKDLQNNPHIVIKPADKGGCTVIQNTIDYIMEAERQLSDTNFYQPQTQDLTTHHNSRVKTLINSLANVAISNEVAKFLIFEKPKFIFSQKFTRRNAHPLADLS